MIKAYVFIDSSYEGELMAAAQVSCRSIVRKEAECANLIASVCLSTSHVAFASIRIQPVFMILGQSARAAASFVITDKVPVQKVDYCKFKARLLEGGQKLLCV